MSMKRQSGSTILVIILATISVGVIATTDWLLYDRHHQSANDKVAQSSCGTNFEPSKVIVGYNPNAGSESLNELAAGVHGTVATDLGSNIYTLQVPKGSECAAAKSLKTHAEITSAAPSYYNTTN